MSTEAEILWGARDLIAERGWCQNTLESYDGKLCAMGAICTAIQGNISRHGHWTPEKLSLYDRTEKRLIAAIGDAPSVANWNDASARTAAEVMAVFEKAAISAEEQGK